MLDTLYLLGTIIAKLGACHQIYKIWKRKSASDLSLLWIATMLGAHFMKLPRTLSTEYWVWWVSLAICIVIIVILLFSVWRFRGGI